MTEGLKEILNIDEACGLLGISAKTFAKILRETDVPGRKIGREWKFSRKALVDWVGEARARDFIDKHKKKIPHGGQELRNLRESELQSRPPITRIVNEKFSVEED